LRVLVVAAHPDDEVLGCGGTIAWHADQGHEVAIHIMAEGATSRTDVPDRLAMAAELEGLRRSAREAAALLGASISFGGYADNRMDSVDLLDVIKSVERVIAEFRPERIYTHHSGDVNIDHSIVHHAVVTACRPVPRHSVRSLLFFETPSSTEWQPAPSGAVFAPNWFVSIETTIEKKLDALKAYESEMREFPHPRSLVAIEHLARWRGASAGVNAAEAFMLGRLIV
jgi:LmbE family N-acetylglucosaminyl deacetylase